MSRPFAERIAAAPISWGVCEVPGWGWQYDVATVLGQMRELGLAATEFGPEGFLPDRGADGRRCWPSTGCAPWEGSSRWSCTSRAHDPVPAVRQSPSRPSSRRVRGRWSSPPRPGATGYDERPVLDEDGWATLLSNLDRLARAAAEVGVTATLHPHVGTMVENAAEVRRVLDDSGIGALPGHRPPAHRRRRPGRAGPRPRRPGAARPPQGRRRRAGRPRCGPGGSAYTDAVREGMYRPLGEGDVDIAAIVTSLERPRLRRLVRARAGHHAHRAAHRCRRRAAGRRPGQRGAPAGRGRGVLNVPLYPGLPGGRCENVRTKR